MFWDRRLLWRRVFLWGVLNYPNKNIYVHLLIWHFVSVKYDAVFSFIVNINNYGCRSTENFVLNKNIEFLGGLQYTKVNNGKYWKCKYKFLADFEVVTAVLSRILACWDVTLQYWVGSFRSFEIACGLLVQMCRVREELDYEP
jgi:hypothetical protein